MTSSRIKYQSGSDQSTFLDREKQHNIKRKEKLLLSLFNLDEKHSESLSFIPKINVNSKRVFIFVYNYILKDCKQKK